MVKYSAVEKRLKLPVFKRIKKLRKLRRRQRIWGIAGSLCAFTACAPLIVFLVTGRLPFASIDGFLRFSDDWAVALGCIIVGLAGTMIFFRQYRRDKDKYDGIRAGAVALIQSGDPVCECKWLPCSCKDELITEMNEKYDINLSY